jgi:hypothetical protein
MSFSLKVSSVQPCKECKPNQEKYRVVNIRPLNRDMQKSYELTYTLQDRGGMSKNGVMQIIVGDIDNNEQFSGSKQISLLTFRKNLQPNSFLGTLYVKDKDDWDLATKRATQCVQGARNLFAVQSGLRIIGPSFSAPPGSLSSGRDR